MGNQQYSAADDGAVNANDVDPPANANLAVEASRPDVDECDLCCDALPGYVCGDLKILDKQWIDEHTAGCGYCQRQLSGFKRLDHLLLEYEQECCREVKPPPFSKRTREIARYGTMVSPLGVLLIAVTDAGVVEITFGRNTSTEEFLSHMVERGFDPVPDQQAIHPVVKQLTEYFQGSRNVFDVPVDFSGLTPFAKNVLQATAAVPFGGVATYSDIAKKIANPGATRAVGNALGRNPVPIILPCHRVVPADHSIGNYTGGVDIKVSLLSIEGALLPTGTLVS
jgi:methylated-DNA-[protein]-cysteine S-methyltransferase